MLDPTLPSASDHATTPSNAIKAATLRITDPSTRSGRSRLRYRIQPLYLQLAETKRTHRTLDALVCGQKRTKNGRGVHCIKEQFFDPGGLAA